MAAINHPDAVPPSPGVFRRDIEGLRGVAILLVLLAHLGVPWLPGGFVGVDVFFVISGFLITSLLVAEFRRTGSLSVWGFYTRRFRRIAPPAVLVIVGTVVVHRVVYGELSVVQSAKHYVSALVGVMNWHVLAEQTSYFGSRSNVDLLTHYWSLGIEEQTYLVWPWLLVMALWVSARRGLWLVLSVLTGVSFVLYLVASVHQPAAAYFGTHTTWWQFGVGALVAVAVAAAPRRGSMRVAPWVVQGCGWLGLLGVVWAAVHYGPHTSPPGFSAILPTLGAAALIAAGAQPYGSWGSSVVLSWSWLRWVGARSYSLYLVHWPAFEIARYLSDSAWWALGLAAFLSFVAAHVLYVGVERPLKTHHWWRSVRATWAGVGSGVVVAVTVVAVTLLSAHQSVIGQRQDAQPFPGSAAVVAADPVETGVRQPHEPFSVAPEGVAGGVFPAPVDAPKDDGNYRHCLAEFIDHIPNDCVIGVRGGTPVVLFGDSHAHHFLPTVEQLAQKYGWQLHVLTKGGCPAPTIPLSVVRAEDDTLVRTQCPVYRERAIAEINRIKPALIFTSMLEKYTIDVSVLRQSWQETFAATHVSGAQWVYISDVPHPGFDVPACVAKHLDNVQRCDFMPQQLTAQPIQHAALVAQVDVAVVSVNDHLCPERSTEKCPAVINGYLLYRDTDHLTDVAARQLGGALQQQLTAAGVL